MRKAVLLAAALVAAVVVVWLWTADRGRGDRRGGRTEQTTPERPEDRMRERPMPPMRGVPPPVDLESVDLDLDLHGIVVEKGAGPIRAAHLQVVSYPWRRASTLNLEGRFEAVEGPTTATARDGTFRLRLRRGENVFLRVRVAGFAQSEWGPLQAGERVRVELERGIHLHVVTNNEAGKPVPGVALRLFPNYDVTTRPFDERRGKTGADGKYTFRNLPSGLRLSLMPQHDDYGPPATGTDLHVPGSGEFTRELVLRRERTVTGTVTDAVTRRPVAGARVGEGWTMWKFVVTDEAGRFALRGWTDGGVTDIVVHADGYPQAKQEVGGRETVDFALVRGGGVRGRAVDAAGAPLEGVLVGIVGDKHENRVQRMSRRHATTAADGRFEAAALYSDLVHTVVLVKPGYARTMYDCTPAQPDADALDLGDLTMRPGRSIEGRVLEADGAPAARVSITLSGFNADRFRLLGGKPADPIWYGQTERRVTDHLGRFRYPDLAPGSYELLVQPRGGPQVKTTVRLPAGKDVLDVQLRVGGGREFVVWVHDEDGNPMQGAWVTITHAGGSANGETDDQGKATFRAQGVIRTIHPPYVGEGYLRPERVTNVPATVHEARIVVKRGAVLAGKVFLPDGEPMEGARLEVTRAGERVAFTTTNKAGAFSTTVPRDGVFDIAFKDARKPYAGELGSVAAGAQDLVMRLTEVDTSRTLVVRLVRPDGTPVKGAAVFGPAGAKTTNAEGVVELTGLPARKTKISAQHDIRDAALRGLVNALPVEVVPSGQEVTLRLRKGVPVRGVLKLHDGRPPKKAYVFATQTGVTLGYTEADAAGRFTLYIPVDSKEKVRIRASHYEGKGQTEQMLYDPATGGDVVITFKRE